MGKKLNQLVSTGGFMLSVACLGLAIYGVVRYLQTEVENKALNEDFAMNALTVEEYQVKVNELVTKKIEYAVGFSNLFTTSLAFSYFSAKASNELLKEMDNED